jgi:spoIIIJ-associated protein
MEWVETTGKTLEEARERVLDQLGVADEDAEIDVLEQPKSGLFGLMRGEARVRGRVRPTEVRPKQDRRRGRGRGAKADETDTVSDSRTGGSAAASGASGAAKAEGTSGATGARNGRAPRKSAPRKTERTSAMTEVAATRVDREDDHDREPVDPAAVGEAAVAFVSGVVEAFGRTAQVDMRLDGDEIEIEANGEDLGLLVGPGGRTLLALQDLTRVVAQRRLGDHVTRLRVDVAGYRQRRTEALQKFVAQVAAQVIETGTPRSLEPMPSSDRKVIHDVLGTIEGVGSRSEGEDPYRRVVIIPG